MVKNIKKFLCCSQIEFWCWTPCSSYLLARSGTKPGEKMFGSGGLKKNSILPNVWFHEKIAYIVSQSKTDLTIDLILFTPSNWKEIKVKFHELLIHSWEMHSDKLQSIIMGGSHCSNALFIRNGVLFSPIKNELGIWQMFYVTSFHCCQKLVCCIWVQNYFTHLWKFLLSCTQCGK